MKTPVAPTPEQDEREVALSHRDPHRFDAKRLLPRSQWEFTRWVAADFVGFFACWGVVALVIGLLWLVVNAGR